jgi:hypothetical protein
MNKREYELVAKRFSLSMIAGRKKVPIKAGTRVCYRTISVDGKISHIHKSVTSECVNWQGIYPISRKNASADPVELGIGFIYDFAAVK